MSDAPGAASAGMDAAPGRSPGRSALAALLGLGAVRLLVLGAALALFAAANAALGYVIVDGRLDGEWYDVRDLGFAVERLRTELDAASGPAVSYWVTAVVGAAGILGFIGGVLLIGSWVERRLLARFQIRRGPNRVGPFGLLQPLADAIKLMQKEVLMPRGADRLLYVIPPIAVFIPAVLAWGPVPWAPNMTYLDINVGVLYVVAVGSLGVLALFMAGWSSNNHYALLGAMRTVAMMISYEIPVSLALLSVVLMTGTLQLSEIVIWQEQHGLWLGLLLPVALVTFFFSSTAEINRTPNDIAEAESEIVAGYHTEYSGMKAGLFIAIELGNAVVLGALVATMFLGGWSLFGLETWIPPYLVFGVKTGAVYFVLVWLRGTLPRFRLDQLMAFAWKYLIPISIANVGVVALEAAILVRVDVAGIVPLGAFTVVNIGLAVALARFAMPRPFAAPGGAQSALQRPALTTAIGGLRASQRMRVSP